MAAAGVGPPEPTAGSMQRRASNNQNETGA